MKKSYLFIGIFVFLIFVISLVGSLIVSGNVLVDKDNDIFDVQKNDEMYFDCYGYSIDNPNIIVNPYGNSPLTAIVLFETDDYSKVDITIKGKYDNDINYTFTNDKYHLIPIYGLYPDYDNTVIISSEKKNKEINIKTDKLPDDFKYVDTSFDNYKFLNGKYPYAIDSYGDVRWYLNSSYYGNITPLSNSKIVIGSDKYTESGNTISFYEMNLLGKIYHEYLIENEYYGVNYVNGENAYILSDKVYLINLQTGEIISDYGKNDAYDYINVVNDELIVGSKEKYFIYKDKKFIDYDYNDGTNNVSPFYNNTINYNMQIAKRYGKLNKTNLSSEKISLIKYSSCDLDNIYVSFDVNRITVKNDNEEPIYIVLDKLFDKRVYSVDTIRYINKIGLNGKYTIYYKIDDKICKTNYYVEV